MTPSALLPLLAFNLGLPELVIILVIVMLLFGATKLPKLARSMGQSVGEFKKGLRDGTDEPAAPADGADRREPTEARK